MQAVPEVKGLLTGMAHVATISEMRLIEKSYCTYSSSPLSKPRIDREGTVSKGETGRPFTLIIKFKSKVIANKWTPEVVEAFRPSNQEALE
jgi:hypothetical protein